MTTTLLRQVTQFDTDRTQATLATPTCSSCCCCCCCLGTTVGMSVAVSRDVHKQSTSKSSSAGPIIAALALPLTVLFWGLLFLAQVPFLTMIMQALPLLPVVAVLPYFALLILAYRAIKHPYPVKRALFMSVVTGLLLVGEVMLGMWLILEIPPLYLVAAAFIALGIVAFMDKLAPTKQWR